MDLSYDGHTSFTGSSSPRLLHAPFRRLHRRCGWVVGHKSDPCCRRCHRHQGRQGETGQAGGCRSPEDHRICTHQASCRCKRKFGCSTSKCGERSQVDSVRRGHPPPVEPPDDVDGEVVGTSHLDVEAVANATDVTDAEGLDHVATPYCHDVAGLGEPTLNAVCRGGGIREAQGVRSRLLQHLQLFFLLW